MPQYKKQFWQHFKGSKTVKINRTNKRKESLRRKTLERMSRPLDGVLSASPSEQDFVDLISRAQCRRYESQRSPYPSPIITRPTPDREVPDGEVDSEVDEENMDTPTNVRRILNEEDEEEEEGGISRSLSVSSDDLNTTHLIPPPSPAAGLRPNRRSVEALKKLLQADSAPFPIIINPPDGGYWVQNGEYESSKNPDGSWHAPEIDTEHFRLETDTTALMYGKHFVGRPHKNFYLLESKFGPLVFSLMIDSDVSCDPLIRMIVRTKDVTHYKVYPSAQLSRKLEPEEYLGIVLAPLNDGEPPRIEGLTRITSKKSPEILRKFDEHGVAKQHKIGVIYQRFGQATEEEMFCNNEHSPAFKEFLQLLGETVKLKGFEKYRGGLDNCNDQTGEYSIYTEYKDQEIMFHVSTLLPYDSGDRQQVARKRHIGNDIVLIVFQDQNTPYSPDCVRSRFLHAHIVVQVEQKNTENTVYKVAVAAKENVPDFSPPLPTPAVFSHGLDFRDWLLTKMLNAEAKCYQAPAFLQLATRTRTQLFSHLMKELSGTKDTTDSIPMHDKRKSLGGLDFYDHSSSPQRRRMTLGTIFSGRGGGGRKVSNTTSPKLQPINDTSSNSNRGNMKHSILATSTPDLSSIGEEPNPVASSGSSATMGRTKKRNVSTIEPPTMSSGQHNTSTTSRGGGGKKKFTFRNKKKKESLTTDILDAHHSREALYVQRSDTSTTECTTSMESGFNWSVPSDLPGVINNQFPPTSLENLSFSLDPLHRDRWASNPDIINSRSRDQFMFLERVPSSATPQSCDVAVQVDTQIFTFPTPPQSVSPTEYQQLHQQGGVVRRTPLSNRVRLLEAQQAEVMMSSNGSTSTSIGMGYQSSSLDNRHSFSFVPEEGRETTPTTNDTTKYDSDSSDSLDDIGTDVTYDSLLSSVQSLTLEVSRLRQQQLQLYHENTKLATKARKWKTKYKNIKSKLTEDGGKDTNTKSKRLSEIGTIL